MPFDRFKTPFKVLNGFLKGFFNRSAIMICTNNLIQKAQGLRACSEVHMRHKQYCNQEAIRCQTK